MFPKFNIGKSGEEYVKYLLEHVGFKCELNNNYELRYDYDLTVNMNGRKFTIEVKFDIFSRKSNNWAIEIYNCKSKCPSGIYSTLADVWVHLIPDKNTDHILAYAISVEKLKHFIENSTPCKKIIAGGDANANLLLYKREEIENKFIRFDLLKEPKLLESIFLEMVD